jgi:hypothetical protein
MSEDKDEIQYAKSEEAKENIVKLFKEINILIDGIKDDKILIHSAYQQNTEKTLDYHRANEVIKKKLENFCNFGGLRFETDLRDINGFAIHINDKKTALSLIDFLEEKCKLLENHEERAIFFIKTLKKSTEDDKIDNVYMFKLLVLFNILFFEDKIQTSCSDWYSETTTINFNWQLTKYLAYDSNQNQIKPFVHSIGSDEELNNVIKCYLEICEMLQDKMQIQPLFDINGDLYLTTYNELFLNDLYTVEELYIKFNENFTSYFGEIREKCKDRDYSEPIGAYCNFTV